MVPRAGTGRGMVPGAGWRTPSPRPLWPSWLHASSHRSFDETGIAPGGEGWPPRGLPDTPPHPLAHGPGIPVLQEGTRCWSWPPAPMGPGSWPTLSQAHQTNVAGLRTQCLTWPLPTLYLLPGIPSSTGKTLTHPPPLAHTGLAVVLDSSTPAWPMDPRVVLPASISLPNSKPC